MARKRISPETKTETTIVNVENNEGDFDISDLPINKPTISANAKTMMTLSEIAGFRPAGEVLENVRAIKTRFPIYDHATKVNGHPLARVAVIHGPSSHGKTSFLHGLGESFIRSGNGYNLIDAEHTTPFNWVKSIMGDAANSPLFVADRPRTYEKTVEKVRKMLKAIIDGKKAGNIDPDFTVLFGVDSIRKLVPEGVLKKLTESMKKDNGAGIDGYGGRAGQIKAALNAAWLDELVPMLSESGCTMCIIARESQNTTTDIFAQDYKMTGGSALEFDSSLIIRVERNKYLTKGEGKEQIVFGEQHRLTIRKTKVSKKDGKTTIGYFHTSNGVLSSEGFDRARDVFYLATRFDIINQAGSWFDFEYNGESHKFQGEEKVLIEMRNNPELLMYIENACRERFDSTDTEESDDQ